MAEIDVTELLYDPDFVDPCVLVHRTASVNSYGENVTIETRQPTIGSIQPASGKTIQRLPEAMRVANISSFWIKAGIVSDGSGGKYPDIIVFKNKRYQVQTVLDYSNWGAGWAEGTCVVETPAG